MRKINALLCLLVAAASLAFWIGCSAQAIDDQQPLAEANRVDSPTGRLVEPPAVDERAEQGDGAQPDQDANSPAPDNAPPTSSDSALATDGDPVTNGGVEPGGQDGKSAEPAGVGNHEVAQAPPPPRQRGDQDLEVISFDDLNMQMQASVKFRPFMLTDRVKELDGRKVRISGVIYPSDRIDGIKSFVLLRNAECKYGDAGQADHLVSVKLRNGVTTSYREDFVSVEGVLRIKPFDGPSGVTWSVFDLEQASNVKTLRR